MGRGFGMSYADCENEVLRDQQKAIKRILLDDALTPEEKCLAIRKELNMKTK